MTFNFTNIHTFCTKSLFKSSVQLTKDRFPNINRGPYAIIGPTDVDYFKKLLGTNHFITGEEVKPYNEDWLKSVSGKYILKNNIFCSQ